MHPDQRGPNPSVETGPAGRPNSVLPGLCALLVVAASVVLSCFGIADSDLFWHVRNGYETLASWSVAHQDVYSHTVKGEFYAYYSWLWEVLAALLHKLGGFELLVLAKAIWCGLGFVALAGACYVRGARGYSIAWALLYGLVLVRFRLYARPEVATLVLLVVFDMLAVSYLISGKRRLLAPLPVLALLWGNLHPYAIVGIGLLSVHAIGEWTGRSLGLRSSGGAGRPGLLGAVTVASFLATLVNPYGLRIYTPALKLFSSSPIASAPTREWLPPTADDFLLFFVLAAVAAGLLLTSVRRARLQDLALFGGTLLLALVSLRNIGIFAVVSTGIVASHLHAATARLGPWLLSRAPGLTRWVGPPVKTALLCAAVVAVTVTMLSPRASLLHLDKSRAYRFGLGLARYSAPVAAVDFIEEHRLEGPLYNSWAFGGYLIWRSWPRLEVFVDGRQMVFEDLIARVSSNPAERTIREMDIRLALVDYEEEGFARAFASLDDFELVFFDDLALVFARRDLIERHGRELRPYRLLEPHDLSLKWAVGASPAKLEAMREEARRAAREAPGAARAALLEGMLARRAGDTEESERAYRRAVELDPTRGTYHNNLGQALLDAGDAQGALGAFRQAIALDPRSFAAHYNNGLALAGRGREREARRSFRSALRRDPGRPEAHFSLGMLETETGAAKRHLTRALELSPDPDLEERIRTRLDSLDRAGH